MPYTMCYIAKNVFTWKIVLITNILYEIIEISRVLPVVLCYICNSHMLQM